MLGVIVATTAAYLVVPIRQAEAVDLERREIRVADVADLRGIDDATGTLIGGRVIARVPLGRSSLRLSRGSLANLVRRRVPLLHLREQSGSILFHVRQPSPHVGESCFAVARDLARGTMVTASDFIADACPEKRPSGMLAFDRANGILRASADLKTGMAVGRISPATAPAVEKGSKLTLVARSGPIRVERPVVALQAGRVDGRIFVIDEERNVTSVPVALETAVHQ